MNWITTNIELNHRVTKLIAENEHLKQTYKQLYDSIKPARIRSKEQCDDLINQVNIKSAEISDLQEKALAITTLKDELRKLKGKALVDNNVSNHPSDPELHQVNVEPITPKLLNKRTAHSAYIKHSQEEAAVLRDLVNHIKANYPLDPLLESALQLLQSNPSPSLCLLMISPLMGCFGLSETSPGKGLLGNWSMGRGEGELWKRLLAITALKDELGNLKEKPVDIMTAHSAYIKHSQKKRPVLRDLVDLFKANYHLRSTFRNLPIVMQNSRDNVWKPTGKVFTNIGYIWRPTGRIFTIVGNACPLTRITTTTKVPLRKSSALDNKTPKPVVTLVYSRKPRKSKTSVPVNNYKVVQIILWYLDSGCSKHMTGDRSQLTNFVSKFLGTVKFGKSTKKPHKPKSEDTNQEKLYLLHMDLCGAMRVASVNGKKYILVIVDD
ncbi:hypothetical protein Tco_1456483 [Tanacetum coccineum]